MSGGRPRGGIVDADAPAATPVHQTMREVVALLHGMNVDDVEMVLRGAVVTCIGNAYLPADTHAAIEQFVSNLRSLAPETRALAEYVQVKHRQVAGHA
jgi:hypothetical protein